MDETLPLHILSSTFNPKLEHPSHIILDVVLQRLTTSANTHSDPNTPYENNLTVFSRD